MSRRFRMSRKHSRRSYRRGQRIHRRNLTVRQFSKRGGTRV